MYPENRRGVVHCVIVTKKALLPAGPEEGLCEQLHLSPTGPSQGRQARAK